MLKRSTEKRVELAAKDPANANKRRPAAIAADVVPVGVPLEVGDPNEPEWPPPGRRGFVCTGTLDIETHDWDTFVVGAIYDGHRPRVFYSGDELIDHLREVGGMWFAHAGGVYDLLYVLERARVRGIPCQVDRSQHRVTRIVMGKLTLRDSYALWPVPLDDICGALGRAVPHLPWACVCGKTSCACGVALEDGSPCTGCGGYCRIGEKAAKGDPELEDYCKADCRALYDGLHWLDEQATTHRIAVKGTMGQTAWIAAQDELGVPDSEIPWELWRHAKRADKGGRASIIRPKARGPGSHHDICNAYPAQLAKAHLPIGACRELGARRALRALIGKCPGVYQATVTVPDSLFLPPLPWHSAGKLTFPTGTFSGTWALPELEAAIERGVSLDTVHSALIWEAAAPIFQPLVERWYAIRRAVGRKTPFGQWIGRLAKAITGKLAEKPDRNRVTMHPDEIKICLRKGACARGCTKRCGAYEQLDLLGHIYAIPYQRLGPSSYPQWSAYLRAMTRVQWLEQAERYGEDLCFGNTDSLWTVGRKAPSPLGDDLGQWEYQHAWWDLEVRSVTMYAFRLEEGGPLQIRGIPGISEEDWRRGRGTLDRGVVTFGRGVKSIRHGKNNQIVGGLFEKRHRRWTMPKSDDDRVWYGDRKLGAGGITYPVDAQELRELARSGKDPGMAQVAA
jgi:hypothetical protein